MVGIFGIGGPTRTLTWDQRIMLTTTARPTRTVSTPSHYCFWAWLGDRLWPIGGSLHCKPMSATAALQSFSKPNSCVSARIGRSQRILHMHRTKRSVRQMHLSIKQGRRLRCEFVTCGAGKREFLPRSPVFKVWSIHKSREYSSSCPLSVDSSLNPLQF